MREEKAKETVDTRKNQREAEVEMAKKKRIQIDAKAKCFILDVFTVVDAFLKLNTRGQADRYMDFF